MKKIVFLICVIVLINFVIGFNIKSDLANFSLQQAEAAWFEFGESSKELEYQPNVIDCTVAAYVYFEYGAQIDISLTLLSLSGQSGITYEVRNVAGKKTTCANGKVYRDCSDIVGTMDSILGEGDCVPKK